MDFVIRSEVFDQFKSWKVKNLVACCYFSFFKIFQIFKLRDRLQTLAWSEEICFPVKNGKQGYFLLFYAEITACGGIYDLFSVFFDTFLSKRGTEWYFLI